MKTCDTSAQIIKNYLAQGQVSKAIALCRQELQRDAHRTEIYPLLGEALRSQGKLSEAIAVYHQALQVQPRNEECHASLGLLYSQQGNLATAADHYQQAIALKPDRWELYYYLATILHQLERWNEAMANYEQAIALQPNDTRAYFNLGCLYDQQGNLPEAISNYRQVIALEPKNLKAYSNLGAALFRENQLEDAVTAYRQALAIKNNWATLHNNLGQVFQAQGNLGEAFDSYRRAIKLEPNLALAHYNLGRLWLRKEDYDAAIACFRKVIALKPNASVYTDCASALMRQGNFSEAMDYFRAAIKLQPEFVEGYCQRAHLLQGEDSLTLAKISCVQFLEALQQHFDIPKICLHLAQTYVYLGDMLWEYGALKPAEDCYHQALQIQPQNPEIYLKLGKCLAQQKRFSLAITMYHMGLTAEPYHPPILVELAQVLAKQERYEQAIPYYENVIQLQHLRKPKLNLSKPNSHDSNTRFLKGVFPSTQGWIASTKIQGCEYFCDNQDPQETREIPLPLAWENPDPTPGCGGVTCSTCMGKLCDGYKPQKLGNGVFLCSKSQDLPISEPNIFVTKIPEGRAWIVPQKNDWLITNAIAIMTPDNYLLADLSRHYPWYLPGCEKYDPTRHPLLAQEELPPLEKIDGKVAILSSLSTHVYYHWMIDVLPRLGIIQKAGINLEEIDWFVVNNTNKSFQQETLATLGIPNSKILTSDTHPHIQAQEMIVPSYPGHLDWVPWDTIEFLRDNFLTQPSSDYNHYPERIYISRANASYRRVLNEDKVIDLLSQCGFTTVYLEKMSIAEQARLFAHAKVIVAPHGAGLTNLVFCSPKTKLVEFFSPRYLRTDYWMITEQLDMEHYFLVSENFDCSPIRQLMYPSPLTEDIIIKLDSLYSVLNRVLSS